MPRRRSGSANIGDSKLRTPRFITAEPKPPRSRPQRLVFSFQSRGPFFRRHEVGEHSHDFRRELFGALTLTLVILPVPGRYRLDSLDKLLQFSDAGSERIHIGA